MAAGLEFYRVEFDADDEGGVLHAGFDFGDDFEDYAAAIFEGAAVFVRALWVRLAIEKEEGAGRRQDPLVYLPCLLSPRGTGQADIHGHSGFDTLPIQLDSRGMQSHPIA